MKQLLWINACMRGPEQSRTDALCRIFLEKFANTHQDWTVKERNLAVEKLDIMDAARAQRRDKAVEEGDLDAPELEIARELAAADAVVIGAPYWDLSFPAQLKVYLEWASTLGITFHYTETGESEGLCRADKLLYITTAGGPVWGQNFGFDYVKALANMLGIGCAECVAAENLDVFGGPGEENMKKAGEQLRQLAKTW